VLTEITQQRCPQTPAQERASATPPESSDRRASPRPALSALPETRKPRICGVSVA
jgi:hypothetical protein